MFSLMCGLWELAFTKKEYRILVLGVDGSGKTTMIEKLKSLYLGLEMPPKDKIFPTIGLNIAKFEVPKAQLVFWDLGGEASLRSIWEKYYTSNISALIFMVDISNPTRLNEAESVFEGLVHPNSPLLNGNRFRYLPMLILANKKDLSSSVPLSEVESRFLKHITKYERRSQTTRVLDVSAITGDGLREAVNWLVETIELSERGITT